MNREEKVKNVIAMYKKRYDIEDITIICGYEPLYSGKLNDFYSNCDIKMVVYRNQLLERCVIEKKVLASTKLFIFIKEEYRTCDICKQEIKGVPCISRKNNKLVLCAVCGSREALENSVKFGHLTQQDMNDILDYIKRHYKN